MLFDTHAHMIDPVFDEDRRELLEGYPAAGVSLGVWASNISDLYDTVKKLEAKGNKNLVLDVTADTARETLKNAVLVRRTAIKDGDRTFGYPSIVNVAKLAHGNAALQTAYAKVDMLKEADAVKVRRDEILKQQ